jgi:fermentation-respiration switch protein FrsA (DUF1100 family)
MSAPPSPHTPGGQRGSLARWLVAALLLVTGLATVGYAGLSVYIATRLVYVPQLPIKRTPADRGLAYRPVTFPAREDGVELRGWFVPGVLPGGQLTAQRTLIIVHGTRQNRTDPAAGLLDLTAALARHGFAVLAFDMRGMGKSPPAPISFGSFEQRDALGAVDFLRSGPLPYPELGRPRAIGGFGVSMGAATLLLAAAREPAIQAVVSDSAYADVAPVLEQQVPQNSGLPPAFTPGTLLAAQALYGVNYYAVRPVDVVARIAPRPIFFIHGARDSFVLPYNQDELYAAASAPPNARASYWRVPGADHAQSFHTAQTAYVDRVVAFFTAALGPDTSAPPGG